MKRFNWRKSFSAVDAFAVVDTHRARRHVATCLTEESAASLAQKLSSLRLNWWAAVSTTGRVTVIAEATMPDGQTACGAWHVSPMEAGIIDRNHFECVVTIVEDRLYAVVAAEHASRR